MNKEIESVIFSNVGNRLTQELAMGMVMTLAQVLNQAVQAERESAAAVPSGVQGISGASAAGVGQGEPAAIIDPAYQRKPTSPRRSRKAPIAPKAATGRKPQKARQ